MPCPSLRARFAASSLNKRTRPGKATTKVVKIFQDDHVEIEAWNPNDPEIEHVIPDFSIHNSTVFLLQAEDGSWYANTVGFGLTEDNEVELKTTDQVGRALNENQMQLLQMSSSDWMAELKNKLMLFAMALVILQVVSIGIVAFAMFG